MHILKKPDLTDPKLRAKLAKGMGHNYYLSLIHISEPTRPY